MHCISLTARLVCTRFDRLLHLGHVCTVSCGLRTHCVLLISMVVDKLLQLCYGQRVHRKPPTDVTVNCALPFVFSVLQSAWSGK